MIREKRSSTGDELVPSRYALRISKIDVRVVSDGVLPLRLPSGSRRSTAAQLRLFDEEHEVAPRVIVHRTGGHIPGHSVVRLASGDDRLTFAGDAMFTVGFEHPDRHNGFEHDPEEGGSRSRPASAGNGDDRRAVDRYSPAVPVGRSGRG